MGYPQGINFRSTLAFVTDVSPADFCSGATAYPHTTAQGNTVGWETPCSDRDRLNTNIAQLAGIAFIGNTGGAFAQFRFDLPSAGTYNIRVAAGDASNDQIIQLEVFDTSTSLGVLLSAANTTVAQKFFDAAGNLLTNTTWLGSNVAVSKTFSTTICRFKLGNITASANSALAYLYIQSAVAAQVPYTPYSQLGPILAQ